MLISTQLARPAGRWSDTVTQIDALRDSSRLLAINCWDDSRLTLRRRAQAAAGASVIQVNSTQLARPAGRDSSRLGALASVPAINC